MLKNQYVRVLSVLLYTLSGGVIFSLIFVVMVFVASLPYRGFRSPLLEISDLFFPFLFLMAALFGKFSLVIIFAVGMIFGYLWHMYRHKPVKTGNSGGI